MLLNTPLPKCNQLMKNEDDPNRNRLLQRVALSKQLVICRQICQ